MSHDHALDVTRARLLHDWRPLAISGALTSLITVNVIAAVLTLAAL